MDGTYTVVILDDHTEYLLPAKAFEALEAAWLNHNHASRTAHDRSMTMSLGLVGGGQVAFRLSSIRHLSIQTPDYRRMVRSLWDFPEEGEEWRQG